MATKKESKKKTSSRKRKGASRRSGGLFGLGLGKVATTFSLNKLIEIAKLGGMALVGYIGANMAGKAVSKMVNKEEQNPQGIKKYANALAQGAITAVCLRMGKKYNLVRMASYGAALSTAQVTVETISGKSVLDMFKFGKSNATNGMGEIAGSEELILPELAGSTDEDINGADADINGADDDFDGIDDFEGIEDEDISGADDDDEGISGEDDDFDGFDDDDEGISGDDIIE